MLLPSNLGESKNGESYTDWDRKAYYFFSDIAGYLCQ